MIPRIIAQEALNLAKQYPIVTFIGPRQSGKTTLCRAIFPEKPYVNLEAPDIAQFAKEDPRGFLHQYPEGAMLDEIQKTPELLSYLQVIVDENPKKGAFILTGSHQLSLHAAITQSLAGRTALLTLLPLSMQELKQANITQSLDSLLFAGGYPRIYHDHLEPLKAHRNYLQTYLERDVRQLINLKDLHLFQQFIKLCAGRIGQILQYQSLSNELGVSAQTIKHWLSILEASFIIFQLQPYYENLGKRIIKSPKLYFTDVGLASYLLDIQTPSQTQHGPFRGALVENLCILEMLKCRFNAGLDPQLYYYRDNHQHEVDVIYKSGNDLTPIEIKSSQTFHANFISGLSYFKKIAPDRCKQGYLIYTGEHQQKINTWTVLNYQHIDTIF
ncbi:MAG: ATP-binding protein [Gammaproteobacteria bacterium]|nr:ATP-binding protein [Gammaproteobacteria bacterium]